MGEKKQKSRKRAEILSSSVRCVYCDSTTPDTLEHMPPRGLFRQGTRPSGWEFAACSHCNQVTRGSDAVAQFFALLDAFSEEAWKRDRFAKLASAIKVHAPGVWEELFNIPGWRDELLQHRGLLRPTKVRQADGPLTKFHLDQFAAKITMAGFAHFLDRPIGTDGVIFTQWFSNGGMNRAMYEIATSIMPHHTELQQGTKVSGKQFSVRYNTDGKSIVAATYSFHGSLNIMSVATDGDEFMGPLTVLLSERPLHSNNTTNLIEANLGKWTSSPVPRNYLLR